MDGRDLFKRDISGGQYTMFTIRTVMMFAGIALIWAAFKLLWELRPIRRKRWTFVTDAVVTEVTEERRSSTINSYYIPRFEYLKDGKKEYYSPKDAVRPCRLRVDEQVVLCLDGKGRFRAIRKRITFARPLIMLAAGLLMLIPQMFGQL